MDELGVFIDWELLEIWSIPAFIFFGTLVGALYAELQGASPMAPFPSEIRYYFKPLLKFTLGIVAITIGTFLIALSFTITFDYFLIGILMAVGGLFLSITANFDLKRGEPLKDDIHDIDLKLEMIGYSDENLSTLKANRSWVEAKHKRAVHLVSEGKLNEAENILNEVHGLFFLASTGEISIAKNAKPSSGASEDGGTVEN